LKTRLGEGEGKKGVSAYNRCRSRSSRIFW
jgi:hypothetical protein